MKDRSIADPIFQAEVSATFASAPEVLVVVSVAYGAGQREFVILRSEAEFKELIARRKRRDHVAVMRSFTKIIEGTVDTDLIDRSVALYTEGKSWILVGPDNFEYTADWSYAESVAELQEELGDRIGKQVCIVDELDYISDETSLGAYVPDEDGVVRLGAY